jgi:hypothetical protein
VELVGGVEGDVQVVVGQRVPGGRGQRPDLAGLPSETGQQGGRNGTTGLGERGWPVGHGAYLPRRVNRENSFPSFTTPTDRHDHERIG